MSADEIADELIVSLHAGYETNGLYTDAFLARPANGQPRPGMVLLSGMHGLSWCQREITRYYGPRRIRCPVAGLYGRANA